MQLDTQSNQILLYAAIGGMVAGAALITTEALRQRGSRRRLEERDDLSRLANLDPGFMYGYPVAGANEAAKDEIDDDEIYILIEERITPLDGGDSEF